MTRWRCRRSTLHECSKWCAARVPEHARHQVRIECQLAPRHLTILERRAPWREDSGPEWTSFPIARLRYTIADKSWTLYWRDRNLRLHSYDRLTPSQRVEDLLTEIDRDPPTSSGDNPKRPPSGRGQARRGNHQMGPLTSVTVEPAWGIWPTFRDRVGPVRRVAAGFLIIYL